MKRLYFVLFVCCIVIKIHAGTGLLHEYGRSSQVVLYDNYFNSCMCALVCGVDSANVDAFLLALTFEEGNIDVKRGMEMSFKFRSGFVMKLVCVSDVSRSDIRVRRFKNHKIKYVTCYYRIQWDDLVRLMDEVVYQIDVETETRVMERKLKKVKNKFSKMYKELIDNK